MKLFIAPHILLARIPAASESFLIEFNQPGKNRGNIPLLNINHNNYIMKKISTQSFLLLLLIFLAIHLAAFLSKDFRLLALYYVLFTSCAAIAFFVDRREAKRNKKVKGKF